MGSQIDIEARICEAQKKHPHERIDCYMLFESHTDAMAMLTCARTCKLDARISTTPRQAQASCGVALLVAAGDAQALIDMAYEQRLPFEDMLALECQIHARRDKYC